VRIAVAMSGGVDSSVVAARLHEEGHDVVGFFMRNGIEADHAGAKKSCCSASDARDASVVADQLGMPFYSLNIADGFGRLLDYFADEYLEGRTPSPCVHCNGWLKFGALLRSARECGAEAVATGHYARVDLVDGPSGAYHRLRKGLDGRKDQSYFLFTLTQEQLAACRFPLGEMTKPEVREHARRLGLAVTDKPESQEICFAPSGDYAAVVERVSGSGRTRGPSTTRSDSVEVSAWRSAIRTTSWRSLPSDARSSWGARTLCSTRRPRSETCTGSRRRRIWATRSGPT